ncbi:flagellar hook-basal body complex protein [Ruminococcus sp. HUN007]|uniref:flagellar hook-basal body complex protein n=1 Tax=Ruminococcus sp. HUN007 TaxID=1514668 RepID=UPI0005D19E74|nr:flagellar hook-basal body complex protein [Ruminococcus sp. HUN007]
MLTGFYTAGSGILNQQRNVNIIGNNISNNQTAGYRAQRMVTTTYEHNFLTRLENGVYHRIGEGEPAIYTEEVETIFDESYLKETENPYDMALVGRGYFNIAGNNSTYLTRNGNFNIDAEGYLVLEGIGRVQGRNGDMRVGGADYTITPHGLVYDNEGVFVDRILVTAPAEGTAVKKFDNGMFVADNVEDVDAPTVYQNHLEQSNVDMNEEYTGLIEAQRALQACASALKMVDKINEKAAGLSGIS